MEIDSAIARMFKPLRLRHRDINVMGWLVIAAVLFARLQAL